MRKLPVLSALLMVSWFLVSGFGLFAPKKQAAQSQPAEEQPAPAQEAQPAPAEEQAEPPVVEEEAEEDESLALSPEGVADRKSVV